MKINKFRKYFRIKQYSYYPDNIDFIFSFSFVN